MNCKKCGEGVKSLVIHEPEGELWCWPCHNEVKYAHLMGVAPSVIGDDIPGGVEIKHGICNEDGTPRRYYTKSSIREAAYNAGYFQGTDTPKVHPKIAEERAKQREARKRG